MDLGLGRLEKVGIVLLLILAAAFGGFLIQDEWLISFYQKKKGRLVSVGKVVAVQNDARIRYPESLVWLPARAGVSVYEGESFFSGANSKVSFSLGSNVLVELAENSLIRLGKNGSDLVLDLKLGSSDVEIPTNTGLLVLTDSGFAQVTSKVKGSQVQLYRTASKFDLRAKIGEIEVEKNGESRPAPVDQPINLKDAFKKAPVIEPTPIEVPPVAPLPAPVVEAPVPPPAPAPAPVPAPVPAPAPQALPQPKTSAKVVEKPKQPVAAKIEGPKAPVKSAPSIPKIEPPKPPPQIVMKAPRLLSPADNADVVDLKSSDGKPSPAPFVWEPIPEAEEYIVQFSKNGEFAPVLKEFKASKSSLVLRSRTQGKFFWRVKGRNSKGESNWSQTFAFQGGKS